MMESEFSGVEPKPSELLDDSVVDVTQPANIDSSPRVQKKVDSEQFNEDGKSQTAFVTGQRLDQLWASIFEAFSKEHQSNSEYLVSATKLCQWIIIVTALPVGLLVLNNVLMLLHPSYKEYKEMCVACVNLGIWIVGFINLWYAWKEHTYYKEVSVDKMTSGRSVLTDCTVHNEDSCETLRSGGDLPTKDKTA